jgi:hypothetical protein
MRSTYAHEVLLKLLNGWLVAEYGLRCAHAQDFRLFFYYHVDGQ